MGLAHVQMAKVQSWYMNQGEWSCHAPRWHLRDSRGFLDDLCFVFELPYVSSGLNSSQAQPSHGKSTTMKTPSNQACHNPLQWKPSLVECLQVAFHLDIGGTIHGCGTKCASCNARWNYMGVTM
jgi:hypothetical protein